MYLPYNRPRLIELSDQTWCPPSIRQAIQNELTFLWTHRLWPLQKRPPYEEVSDILEGLLDDIEREDAEGGDGEEKRRVTVVDCCSGAGGPMPAIEKRINERRRAKGKDPVPVVLSDLWPHLPAWQQVTRNTPYSPPSSSSDDKTPGPSGSFLTYIPEPVDATRFPTSLKKDRHIRTFCLSFHHFGEDQARRVIEDAMRSSEGICIFELQEPSVGNFLMLAGQFVLALFLIPFQRPRFSTLFFTYVLPVIPLFLAIDGVISAYRTRSHDHLAYLANKAAMAVAMESGSREGDEGEIEWKWEFGRRIVTRPFAPVLWAIGRKDRGE